MTSVAEIQIVDRSDVGTIVGGGFKLGLITAVGVVVFALLSRPLEGITETILQSVLILVGGFVFAFVPGLWVRARSVDGMGWAMLLGLMGALFFAVVDTIVLRPLNLYHWTWDAIGGGSGFWYLPVWWMGSAYLAGLGALLIKNRSSDEDNVAPGSLIPRLAIITVILFAVIAGAGVLPPSSAVVALAFSLALTVDALISALQTRE